MRDPHEHIRETHIIGSKTREWIVSERVCQAMRQRNIPLAGISDAADGFYFVRKRWDHSQVLACYSGHGEALINGRWHVCRAGMAYLTPPGVEHAYRAVPGTRWGLCWTHHRGPAVSAAAPVLVKVDPRPLRSAIRGLYRESITACSEEAMQLWLDLVHTYAMRLARHGPSDDHLARLWASVASDLGRPWTLAELADRAAMSTEHLRRLCLKHLGRSPMQHVTYLRMKHAGTLLALTDRKIDTVARSIGYSSAFAFSTAFKRITGRSPSEARSGGFEV